VVGSQILIFFLSGEIPQLLNILTFFSETHPKQSQGEWQMYYCTSSVSLVAHVLAGLGEFPVESNEMAMKRTGS